MDNYRKKNRAIIFAPFQSLQGFFDLLRERERIVVPKKELMEDALDELDRKIRQISVGMIVTVIYYDREEYVKLEGMVSKIDLEYTKTIRIVKKEIPILDIVKIEL